MKTRGPIVHILFFSFLITSVILSGCAIKGLPAAEMNKVQDITRDVASYADENQTDLTVEPDEALALRESRGRIVNKSDTVSLIQCVVELEGRLTAYVKEVEQK